VSLVSVVHCQLEVSATGSSLDQGSPTRNGVPECDREASYRGGHDPKTGLSATRKKKCNIYIVVTPSPGVWQ
jgi:hypothetical protein